MLKSLLVLVLVVQSALARQPVEVGHVWPGMSQSEVLAALGQPASRTSFSQHAYVVFSEQPLFAEEQSWYYEGAEGESHLLFRGGRLRMVRALTLQWQGQAYRGEAWPRIKAGVKAEARGLTLELNRAPIIAGFVFSDFDAREQQQRRQRFSLVSEKHHLDARGDIYRGKPGQVCRTCRELAAKLR